MFDRTLTLIENTLITASFLFITLMSFINVLARYVFHGSISFTSELLINLAVLLTLVGASAVTRNGTHPSFSLLRDSLSGNRRKIVVVVICAAMVTFYGVFLWLGMDMVQKQQASGRLTPALQFPQWIFSLALPFGALLGVIRTVQVAYNEIRGREMFADEEAEAIAEAHRQTEASSASRPVSRTDGQDVES